MRLPDEFVELPLGAESSARALREFAEACQRNFEEIRLRGARLAGEPERHVPTLLNGWVSQAGWKTPVVSIRDGMVTIQGTFNGAAAVGVHAMTLPVGLRPTALVGAGLIFWLGGAAVWEKGAIYVQPSGICQLYNAANGFSALTDYVVNLTYAIE